MLTPLLLNCLSLLFITVFTGLVNTILLVPRQRHVRQFHKKSHGSKPPRSNVDFLMRFQSIQKQGGYIVSD
jgi:hypothetical protein